MCVNTRCINMRRHMYRYVRTWCRYNIYIYIYKYFTLYRCVNYDIGLCLPMYIFHVTSMPSAGAARDILTDPGLRHNLHPTHTMLCKPLKQLNSTSYARKTSWHAIPGQDSNWCEPILAPGHFFCCSGHPCLNDPTQEFGIWVVRLLGTCPNAWSLNLGFGSSSS